MTPGILMVIPVEDWQLIDGTIDNTVAVEVFGGDHHAVELGMRIREVGWAQTRHHPKISGAAGGRLPVDDHVNITLEPDAWTFVADQLRRWAAVDSSGAQARRIAGWITRRLAENAE